MDYYLVQFETRLNGEWYTDPQESETRGTEQDAREAALAGLRAGTGERARIERVELIDVIVPKTPTARGE